MKRATYLQFRDPRHPIPHGTLTSVTNEGTALFSSIETRSKSPSRMSQARRFEQYFWIEKHKGNEPGPGYYRPQT